jgi:hypothetical protein
MSCAVAGLEAKETFERVAAVSNAVVESKATKTSAHRPLFEELGQRGLVRRSREGADALLHGCRGLQTPVS